MPNVPPQDVPVMIAQANQAQASDIATTRTIGVCSPISPTENTLDPIVSAQDYFYLYEHRRIEGSASITILQNPKHGALADIGGGYSYISNTGYLGQDSAIFLVDIGGQKVKVVYSLQVVDHELGNSGGEELCGKKGFHWKISSTLDANGNSAINSVEYQSPIIDASASSTDTATLASILGASILGRLSVDPSIVTLNIADLPGGAVGQTVGTNITLDDNAARYGWFIRHHTK